MNLKKHLTTCVIVAIVAAWSPFGGATTYDEAVDGDLSGNGVAPTSLIFGPGSHSISGTTVALDYDIIHLAIGGEFQSLVLSSYASVDNLAFIGVQSGTTWTEGLGGAINPANLLGWSHFGPGNGTDILDNIGVGAGAMGFVPPLPAGDYTFLIQQTGGSASDYTFQFSVVPLPPTVLLLGPVLLVITRLRRAR